MTPAIVRYWCPAVEWTAMQGPPLLNYWTFRAWRYLYALSGLPVCAISSLPQATLDLSSEKSPWYELRECFGYRADEAARLAGGPQPSALAAKFVNIVCGVGGDAHRLYTVGVPNIAITGVCGGTGITHPKADEVDTLRKYEAVICPTAFDADYYKTQYGIDATHVPPDPFLLNPLIERLRQP